ncbi:polysaccharide biosynthesis protein, partial [Acetomicrobium sp. S15 = DSM 107314]|uniref:polysaccharide biosynthesis protein n=1 Tax=Acetomicrobium sp. S15 = DSM 107314 TaxID=2529858 RepID=UPI001E56B488
MDCQIVSVDVPWGEAVAPEAELEVVGIRPGEKLHECLLTEEESRHAVEYDDSFVIEPERPRLSFSRLRSESSRGWEYRQPFGRFCLYSLRLYSHRTIKLSATL